MVNNLKVSQHSDVPVYRQIVIQLTYLIESGDLKDGDRLPGSRLLAANLGINRNTVAHAYRELRAAGLVQGHGRNGMVVVDSARARRSSDARDQAIDILTAAARECAELGLTPAEFGELATKVATSATERPLRISFVECNDDRADYFAGELARELSNPVRPLVLGTFGPETVEDDLVLTTFFHLADVRKLLHGTAAEIVAIVVAPHIQTLVQIAQVPTDRAVGLWYTTEDQALSVRDSLSQAGIENIRLFSGRVTDKQIASVDLMIVPSEMPNLQKRLDGKVRILEFGNVLDAASIRMVREVVRDLRAAHSNSAERST